MFSWRLLVHTYTIAWYHIFECGSSNCHDVVHWWFVVNRVGTVVAGCVTEVLKETNASSVRYSDLWWWHQLGLSFVALIPISFWWRCDFCFFACWMVHANRFIISGFRAVSKVWRVKHTKILCDRVWGWSSQENGWSVGGAVTGGWRKLCDKELNYLYLSPRLCVLKRGTVIPSHARCDPEGE